MTPRNTRRPLSVPSTSSQPENRPELRSLVHKRLSPGVLVFNMKGKLLYLNHDALELLRIAPEAGSLSFDRFPVSIKRLYAQLKRKLKENSNNSMGPIIKVSALLRQHLILRGLGFHNHRRPSQQAQVLLLIERIGQREKINLPKLQSRFDLSRRESEIVGQVLQGRSNKEIAERLFISPYTVEDHLKNIMRKMDVSSRTAIVARLLAE